MRPAFYALRPGGWRDYVTILHPPYTAWHLSYVAVGAGLAPRLDGWRLVATFAAFFLALGIVVALSFSLWLLAFVGAGTFLVFAYNLELLGGAFHSDLWFGLAWGGFPVLTAYFAMAGRLRGEAVVGAAFATLLSLAQRTLSTPVREVRRRGRFDDAAASAAIRPAEAALRLLTAATVAVGTALLLSHLR